AARDPVQECQQAHIQPALLAQRMSTSKIFTVFELGFGAGINFLTIAQEFLRHAPEECRFRFFSCEVRPLPLEVLRETIRATASDLELSDKLIEQYPPPISGIHRRLFADKRIELTLMYTSADLAFQDFVARDQQGVDAWILDGFAPDRNPDMWTERLLGSLASKSRAGATVTTYSSAGYVRRLLESLGFSVDKVSNLPYKRHTTLGKLASTPYIPSSPPKRAVVVGGGFAGCATAQALARRGISVELRTPSGQVADGTSAIPTAVVHARLSASADSAPSIRLQSHAYSQSLIGTFHGAIRCGAIQFPSTRMTIERLERICELLGSEWAHLVSDGQIKELAGLDMDMKGVHFPRTLVVNGGALCSWFTDHPNVKIVQGDVPDLDKADCPTVVATGSPASLHNRGTDLEVTEIEGQMDQFEPTPGQSLLPFAFLHEGYVVTTQNTYSAGSTYEYQPWPKDEPKNTNQLRIRKLFGSTEITHSASFRARRAVTSDHMPIAGRIDSNIWLNLAHGSSGTTSAPFCAEIIASEISGELPPLLQPHMNTLSPDRFEKRQSRRENPFLNTQDTRP
ncbi:MAG: tRNA (5-methylaminomethyl-2-thiouridine)(34)-methyltransferase MnmD, partial [Gammaproteobacteria bacterium]|nr:tRNA (5-methylaminomethyl-2-thiouridine)(34)-methyltransferase MnmD [Gammaproteobacteria bacterium]